MKKELKILLGASAFFALAAGFFGPIYALFVEQIGGDLLTAGAAYSAYAIVAGVLIFVLGKWEDHVKHLEILIIVAYMLNCVGYFGYLLVKTSLHLFIVQILFGIATAVGTPAYDGLYSNLLEKGKFASQWGMWEAMAWIVSGLAAVAGGLIAKLYGFRFLFLIMLIASICGLFISLLLLKPRS